MRHQHISFHKSIFRFGGYSALGAGKLAAAAFLLVWAEVLGVIEEIGHD